MEIDFEKCGGLVPAIIQDAQTKNVLMMGYMNPEAYQKTLETGKVTFWSRSRQCLWTKGGHIGQLLVAGEYQGGLRQRYTFGDRTPRRPYLPHGH